MGQKINPLGFRIQIHNNYCSHWFSSSKTYSNFLKEDDLIRQYFLKIVKIQGIFKILIYRTLQTYLKITIITFLPSVLYNKKQSPLFKYYQVLKQKFPIYKKLKIEIIKLSNPLIKPLLLNLYIKNQILKRISWKRFLPNIIETVKLKKVAGIKIQLSGRLDNALKASTKWLLYGQIPLQKLRANIQYNAFQILTPIGIIGSKVWILVNTSL